jgi:hypothetical protein
MAGNEVLRRFPIRLAVSMVLERASFSAEEQPEFIVRFKNVGMV